MPSGSDEPVPSKATERLFGVEVNAATGGWFGLTTDTDWVTELVAPWLSVTVSLTL